MKKKFDLKLSNSVEPAAPRTIWGKGCAGKGKPVKNAVIERQNTTEKESK